MMLNQYYGQTLSVATVTNYVNDGNPQTVAELLANYPPSANNMGWYGRVSDLYGSVDEVMRCRFDGTNYRWVPQRESFTGTTAASGGTVNLIPLVTPPTLRLTTTGLLSPLNVTPSTVNAYYGQRARVIAPPSLSVSSFIIQITGLIGSNINLLAGNTADIEFGQSGWFKSA